MELRPYLDTLPRGGIADIARKLGISTIYLHQLAAGQAGRLPSPELCVRMERLMPDVSRRDLRPHDWHLIWPELITKQFPAPAQPAAPAAAA